MSANEVIEQYLGLLSEEIERARGGDGMTEVRAKFINEGINMVLDSMQCAAPDGNDVCP